MHLCRAAAPSLSVVEEARREPEDVFVVLVKWFRNKRFNERAFPKDWLESDQPAATHSPELYVSLLRCAGGSSEDDQLSRWVIQRMRDLDITPNLAFYTALLSTQCAQKRYDATFKKYAALRLNPEPALLPNKLVFAHLFRAHCEMYQPRSLRTRTIERPHTAPSPCQLFRDMLLCHAGRTEHGLEGTLTSTSLIPALRVFLWRHDHAATYVVFKVIGRCKVPMNLEMHQCILAPILPRLKEELPLLDTEEGTRSWWTHHFLGLLTSAPRRVHPVYGTPVRDMVLRVGMQPPPPCLPGRGTTV